MICIYASRMHAYPHTYIRTSYIEVNGFAETFFSSTQLKNWDARRLLREMQ